MPYNKDAYMRYRHIDARIRAKQLPTPTLSELVEYVSRKLGKTVSTSSVQKDLKAMRYDSSLGFNAPIEYDTYKKGYYYSEENYSIEQLSIGEEDLQGLELAIGILEQFKNLPAIKQFDEAITRLASTLKNSRAETTIAKKILLLDRPSIYGGAQFMQEVVEAIREKNVTRLKYKTFTGEKEKIHIIHPYFIKEYNGRLYLIANDVSPNKLNKVLTFSFDRMMDVTATNQKFKESYLDSENYFSNALGISMVNDKPEKIILQFDISQAGYLKSQPIHHSQKVTRETKKNIDIELSIVPNYELETLILSYGNKVKVVEPKELKNKIKTIIEHTINLYKK